MSFKSWRKGGTSDFGSWHPGKQIADISELAVGDILFADSAQFDALNLCRITQKDSERGICYATLCNPLNVRQSRDGGMAEPEFAIWHYEFPHDAFGNKFLRALSTVDSKGGDVSRFVEYPLTHITDLANVADADIPALVESLPGLIASLKLAKIQCELEGVQLADVMPVVRFMPETGDAVVMTTGATRAEFTGEAAQAAYSEFKKKH